MKKLVRILFAIFFFGILMFVPGLLESSGISFLGALALIAAVFWVLLQFVRVINRVEGVE